MQLTILAVGSRGDVQPYVALGVGLRRAGFGVKVAAYTAYEPLVGQYGLEYAPLHVDMRQLLEGANAQAWLESGRNLFVFLRRLRQLADPFLGSTLADCWQACQGSEGIIFSTLGVGGYHIAERLRVPCAQALLAPLGRTGDFPSVTSPRTWPLGRLGNRLTHLVEEQAIWQSFRVPFNRWRREKLGLAPIPFFGPYARLEAERLPRLFGYSPSVVPKPGDWPDWYHVTGYWFLERPAEWQAPVELAAFLAAGPAPVYVGLGSMRPRDPEAFFALAVAALRRAGRRGVLYAGWADPASLSASDDVFVVQDVPHDWLFPQVAAVVHHGGAGTTAAALRAGVPAAVIPFFADQPFWADRVAGLDVAVQLLPQKQLTAERLAEALDRLTADAGLQARAAAFGERLRAEDGVGRAVAVLDRHFRGWSSG